MDQFVTLSLAYRSDFKLNKVFGTTSLFQVVGEQGMLYQIEPPNGVTDPKSFSGQEKSSKKGKYIPVELIQDDETFELHNLSTISNDRLNSICMHNIANSYKQHLLSD